VRVHIGSDHAGYLLKEQVKAHLLAQGHDVTDAGPDSEDSVDYPLYAGPVARAVAAKDADFGILVCGTGLGMEIAANKVHGVRAVQISDPEFAKLARMHNNANVLTLAGRYTTADAAAAIVDTFLATPFEGGRHARRVDEIADIENGTHGVKP
jgi:ribose 5-phosphate isomerase B